MNQSIPSIALRPDAAVDFHMHTTYSDGHWPAPQLIDFLANEGFQLVAVTDHDRIDKIDEIQGLGAEKNLFVISGVEMSTEWHGKMGDMLCYGFDPHSSGLSALTENIKRRKLENAREVNENLRSAGYEMPRQNELLKESNGEATSFSDNAYLLREHGHAQSWHSAVHMVNEAGYKQIKVDMATTVDAVHKSGGVCLIAHPGRRENGFTFYDSALLDEVRREVPIDGIEVYHPSHSKDAIAAYLAYVEKNDLLASTGSDSHCTPTRMPIKYRAEISHKLLERLGVKVA